MTPHDPAAFDDGEDTLDLDREDLSPDDEWPVPAEYRTADTFATREPIATDDPGAGPAHWRRSPVRPVAFGLLLVLVLALALALSLILLRDGSSTSAAVPDGGAARGTPPVGSSTEKTETTAPAVGKTVDAPDMEGMTLAEARAELREAGLRVRVRADADGRPGVVLDQSPDAATAIAPGTVVVLLVARAIEHVAVPDVVGLSSAEASRVLRAKGLQPRIRHARSGERAGTVVGQTPEAGAELRPGTTVTVRVARPAAKPVAVIAPRLLGLTLDEATAHLGELGLRWSVTRVVSSRPEGVVVDQAPRPGIKLAKGSVVELEVSRGAAQASVPDVTGLGLAMARQELQAAGFSVQIVDQPTSDPAEDGIVLQQSPEGGASAEEGAAITLTVGRLG